MGSEIWYLASSDMGQNVSHVQAVHTKIYTAGENLNNNKSWLKSQSLFWQNY